jgi:hypothetical protein
MHFLQEIYDMDISREHRILLFEYYVPKLSERIFIIFDLEATIKLRPASLNFVHMDSM